MLRNHPHYYTLTAVTVLALALVATSAFAQKPDEYKGDPYTLGVCAVSGEKLGAMGDPVLLNHEGRDIRFCCAGCPPKFEKDPGQYLSKVDALMVKAQKGHYPLDTDVVSGEPLGDVPVDVIHNNRLLRFSSQTNAQKFSGKADEYLAKLDKAVIAKQKESYPLDKCVITGEALTTMGEPAELVVANRLVLFCCAGCGNRFWKDPHGNLSKIDSGHVPESAEGSDHKEH